MSIFLFSVFFFEIQKVLQVTCILNENNKSPALSYDRVHSLKTMSYTGFRMPSINVHDSCTLTLPSFA